jgi:phage shock protein PspC (stress-responsive transcriptional regulator)
MSNDVKRLYRSRNDRMLGGICGGLAEYFKVDSTLIRVIAVVLLLLTIIPFPVTFVVYLLMWLIIPEAPANSL